MTTLTPTPKQQFLDANGNPLAGGKVYSYAAGTTTPLATYTDQSGSTPNTNPVILDSRGEAAIWLGVASYKLKLTTSTDVEIWTVDSIVSSGVQALADLSEAGGSALVGYLPAGTGAVATTVQAKLRETVSVKDFGAVGNGVADDTAAIQAALAAVTSTGTVLGVQGESYAISSIIEVGNSKTLANARFVYTVSAAGIVLKNASRIENCRFSIGSTLPAFSRDGAIGVISLVGADGATIDNIVFEDGNAPAGSRVGIYCSTAASNISISNIRADLIGWPILFNDDTATISRTYGGTTYTGTIGSNLVIRDCFLGGAAKTKTGDGIEINVPLNRYSNIKVTNCVIRKTNTTTNNGIGIGFANCDYVQVSDCSLSSIAGDGGALHAEACTNVLFSNNFVQLSERAVSISASTTVSIIGNISYSNVIGMSTNSSATFGQNYNLVISGNQFRDTTDYPLILINATYVSIHGNIFSNIVNASRVCINLQQSSTYTVQGVHICNNTFDASNAVVYDVMTSSGTVNFAYSSGNMFTSISSTKTASYIAQVRAIGVSTDYFRTTGTPSGLNVSVTSNPNGYVTGSIGDFALDTTNGAQYTHNGTAWNARTQATAMPTSGSWVIGDVVQNIAPTNAAGQPAGWLRVTTGSGNVLNTDWRAFGVTV